MRPIACRLLICLAVALPAAALPARADQPVALEAQEDLPADYPPKMGEITGTLGGKPVIWETFDFSVGAFDASAWADADWTTKEVSARLMGYKPGLPDDLRGRIYIQGDFGPALRTGAAANPVVEYLRGRDPDGPRLSSEGQTAEFVIDSIGPQVENSYSRRVTGHVTARLCAKDWPLKPCQDITLSFDTDMQMGSTLTVTP